MNVTCIVKPHDVIRCIAVAQQLEPLSLRRVEPVFEQGMWPVNYRIEFTFIDRMKADKMFLWNLPENSP